PLRGVQASGIHTGCRPRPEAHMTLIRSHLRIRESILQGGSPMRSVVWMIMGLLSALAAPLAAQSGSIRGTVADSSGAALANASISVEGTELRTTTGTQGNYEIHGVPAGTRVLRARLIGYRAASAPVTVAAGD